MQTEILCKGNFAVLAAPFREPCGHRPPSLQFTKMLRAMKLVTVAMIAFCLHVSARSVSQTVTLSGKAMPLQKVFNEIKSQTGFLFFYRNEDLAGAPPVSIEL